MVDVLKMRLVREDMRDQIMKIPFDDRGKAGRKGASRPGGERTVCIEESLVGPLEICLETTNLLERLRPKQVTEVFTLSPDPFQTQNRKVVYLIRPRLDVMKMLARHIKHLLQADRDKEIVVVLVPRKTLICEHILEEYRLLQHVDLRELEGVDLFPIANDVLSMELDYTFRELKLDGDTSSLYYIAKSVKKLQDFFGQIPKIRGKGHCADRVCRMLERMKVESGDAAVGQTPEIDSLYLIDRDVDLLTPLMTQVTYEGLIDELYRIDRGSFMPPFEVPQVQAKDGTQRKVTLNSSDNVFAIARDANVISGQCGKHLNARAINIKERLESRNQLKELREIKVFMQKLPELQREQKDLAMHLTITEQVHKASRQSSFRDLIEYERKIIDNQDSNGILDFITDCIFCQEPQQKVLRLICLFSYCNGGLSKKVYDQLKTQMVQNYGVHILLTLENLEKAGLFRRQEQSLAQAATGGLPVGFPGFGGGQMARLRERLDLRPPAERSGTTSEEARDVAYSYHGYAPISVRLIEAASLGKIRGWSSLDSILTQLPGPTYPPDDVEDPRSADEQGTQRVVLVFFIGGCTHAEVSAIRFLTKRSERNADRGEGVYTTYLVATTKLLSGSALIESLYGALR